MYYNNWSKSVIMKLVVAHNSLRLIHLIGLSKRVNIYCRLANNHDGFAFAMFAIDHFSANLIPSWKLLNFQSYISIAGATLCSKSLYVQNNYLLNLSLHCFDITPVDFTMKCIVIVTWVAFLVRPWCKSWVGSKTPNFVTSCRQHLYLALAWHLEIIASFCQCFKVVFFINLEWFYNDVITWIVFSLHKGPKVKSYHYSHFLFCICFNSW
jgi:hypothetical protein